MHSAVHCAIDPSRSSRVHSSPSSHVVGQVWSLSGSHNSPALRTPSPQKVSQSASFRGLASAGQQPSPLAAVVIGVFVQTAVQSAADPVSVSFVQSLSSSQLVGQRSVTLIGSQVSPAPTTPSPQARC